MRILTILIALAGLAEAAGAQNLAPLVARVPAGTRAAALGDAFAGGRGPDVVFYNPAQVGLVTGYAISGARYRGSATLATFATATTVGPVAVGFGVQWLDYEGFNDLSTTPNDLTEPRGPPNQSLVASVALATRVLGFRVGAAAKYGEERLSGEYTGKPSFDLGVARDVSRLSIGLAVQHLGPDLDTGLDDAQQPTRVILGATTSRIPIHAWFDLLATGAVSRERGGRIVPAAGAELVYVPLEGFTASLRAGVRRVEGGGPPARQPVTFGVGLSMDRLWLDYAYETYSGPGGGHRIGIRLQ